MSDAPSSPDDTTYRGETLARNPRVATALSFLCPGLGYVYVGQLIKGLTVNLLFVLFVEMFLLSQAMWKFFPILPALVFVGGWLLLCAIVALDVRQIIEDNHEDYLIKAYNHWLPYGLIILLTFALPVGISANVAFQRVWKLAEVKHSGMFPSLVVGDYVLIDRSGYTKTQPTPGDIVAVSSGKPGAPIHMLRVIGKPKDIVRVEGDMVYLNNVAMTQQPIKVIDAPSASAHNLVTLEEHNRAQRYVITMARGAITRTSVPATRIASEEMFMLTDNRSQIPVSKDKAKMRDSRNFGPIKHDKIRGKPTFVLWSTDPETHKIRWDRIGIRLQK